MRKSFFKLMMINIFLWGFALGHANAGGTEVVQVADGVYAGSSVTKAGEPIYFGMERVDASNFKTWRNYSEYLLRYGVSSGGGTLNYLAAYANNDIKDFSLEARKAFGMDDEELVKFKNMLIYQMSNQRNLQLELSNILGGHAGFNVRESKDKNTYFVVYASKKPVLGKFTVPGSPVPQNMKEFMTNYDHLIMSVGSWLMENKDFYQNRGIFRNPFNLIEGSFKNISLQLHGFTAAVMEKFYPERKFMFVNAIPSMGNIIKKNVVPEDAYIGYENIPDELKKAIPAPNGIRDQQIILKIPALAKFYKQ